MSIANGVAFLSGDLGSPELIMRGPPEAIRQWLPMLPSDGRFSKWRQSLVDVARGVIAFMAPTRVHELAGVAARQVVEGAVEASGQRCVLCGSPTLNMASDADARIGPVPDARIGPVPDACFHIGEAAKKYMQAKRAGAQQADAFERTTPPTLVVEVEVTSHSADKMRTYADLRIAEYWHIKEGQQKADLSLDMRLLSPKGVYEATDVSAATRLPVASAERLIQLFCIEVAMTSSERQAAVMEVLREAGLDAAE